MNYSSIILAIGLALFGFILLAEGRLMWPIPRPDIYAKKKRRRLF